MLVRTDDKVNVIATYFFLVGGLMIVLAVASIVVPVAAVVLGESEFLARLPGWFLGTTLLVLAGALLTIGLIHGVVGWGLWQIRPWGRMAAMIIAIFTIVLVPIGTLAGGFILYVLLQDQTRELFVGPPGPV